MVLALFFVFLETVVSESDFLDRLSHGMVRNAEGQKKGQKSKPQNGLNPFIYSVSCILSGGGLRI